MVGYGLFRIFVQGETVTRSQCAVRHRARPRLRHLHRVRKYPPCWPARFLRLASLTGVKAMSNPAAVHPGVMVTSVPYLLKSWAKAEQRAQRDDALDNVRRSSRLNR
jgi:hypothetical protein